MKLNSLSMFVFIVIFSTSCIQKKPRKNLRVDSDSPEKQSQQMDTLTIAKKIKASFSLYLDESRNDSNFSLTDGMRKIGSNIIAQSDKELANRIASEETSKLNEDLIKLSKTSLNFKNKNQDINSTNENMDKSLIALTGGSIIIALGIKNIKADGKMNKEIIAELNDLLKKDRLLIEEYNHKIRMKEVNVTARTAELTEIETILSQKDFSNFDEQTLLKHKNKAEKIIAEETNELKTLNKEYWNRYTYIVNQEDLKAENLQANRKFSRVKISTAAGILITAALTTAGIMFYDQYAYDQFTLAGENEELKIAPAANLMPPSLQRLFISIREIEKSLQKTWSQNSN